MTGSLHRNVWVLAAAQSLVMCLGSMVVFVGGIIGSDLAPSSKMATMPVAAMIVGTACSVFPISFLMRRFGRRRVFLTVLAGSIGLALFISHAIIQASFAQFVLGTFLFGMTVATVMQFRFAAMESAKEENIPIAASTVLVGGILAAYLGPELSLAGKGLLETPFAGSFILLAGLFVLAFFILLAYKNTAKEIALIDDVPRPVKEITRQAIFWVALFAAAIGYAIMSFIMTATPVSMNKIDGLALEDVKWVIQSHVLAMYAPSLITGLLVKKFGLRRLMFIGLFLYLCCIGIAWSGQSFLHYWLALILLGLGWNFLFVGGTVLLSKTYRPSERFKIQAINDFSILGMQSTAALCAGWVVFSLGWQMLLLLVLPLIAFQFFLLLRTKF